MTSVEVENYGNRAVIRSSKFTIGVNKKGVKVIVNAGLYVDLVVLNAELVLKFRDEMITENDVDILYNEVSQVNEMIKKMEKLKLRN